jgi:hypothetical protein
MFERLAETFAAMTGDEDQPPCRIQKRKSCGDALREPRVSGQLSRVCSSASITVLPVRTTCSGVMPSLYVLLRALRRREVPRRHGVRHTPVQFLRPRRPDIAGTKPGLDVSDRDVPIEGGQARRQGGGRIAVNQHDLGPAASNTGPMPFRMFAVSSDSDWF